MDVLLLNMSTCDFLLLQEINSPPLFFIHSWTCRSCKAKVKGLNIKSRLIRIIKLLFSLCLGDSRLW